MMCIRTVSLLSWIFLFSAAVHAAASERLALVFANGNYTAVRPVSTSSADGRLVAEALRANGYDVSLIENADFATMTRGVAEFGRKLRAAPPDTTVVFYYSGHGLSSGGTNYLLPIDADISAPADLPFVALAETAILDQIGSGQTTRGAVIVDCCGVNPFPDILDLKAEGLDALPARDNLAVIHAAARGAVASDARGENSALATALMTLLEGEAQPVDTFITALAEQTAAASQGTQDPWHIVSPGLDMMIVPPPPLTPEEQAELDMWQLVETTTDPLDLMTFIQKYPDGQYSAEAKRLLSALLSSELNGQASGQAQVDEVPANIASTAFRGLSPDPGGAAPTEEDLITRAEQSGAPQDYQAYLDAYPDGVFSELARVELAVIAAAGSAAMAPQQAPAETESRALAPVAAIAGAPAATPDPDPAEVAFNVPLEVGAPEITGKTIAQLIKGSPLFPPVEGLPESYWKSETCSNCHQWTREDLCTQANFYMTEAGARNLGKQHPLGGSFKRNLRAWAQGGCQ